MALATLANVACLSLSPKQSETRQIGDIQQAVSDQIGDTVNDLWPIVIGSVIKDLAIWASMAFVFYILIGRLKKEVQKLPSHRSPDSH